MRNPALVCTGCGATYALDSLTQRCSCNEPVEVRGLVDGARPRSSGTLLERYQEFLPLVDPDPRLSLGEGNTPLIRARQLEALLKVGSLNLKIEGQNPSGSFKDRGTVAGVTWTMSHGVRRIGTVSTGNMGGSVAAYAARDPRRTGVYSFERETPASLSPGFARRFRANKQAWAFFQAQPPGYRRGTFSPNASSRPLWCGAAGRWLSRI